jgi:hypothetical protein
MQSLPLVFSDFHMIIPEVVVLHGSYDVDQYWFSFMVGCAFKSPEPESDKIIDHKLPFRRGVISPSSTEMFIYERGFHQHTLPFAEYRRVSARNGARLMAAGYPSWEQDENGDPLCILLKEHRRVIDPWLYENTNYKYLVQKHGYKTYEIFFERAEDYIMARMFFGGV